MPCSCSNFDVRDSVGFDSYRCRCRGGKIIPYNPETGHRIKDNHFPPVMWLHTNLKAAHLLPPEWRLTQCLFGEHLLQDKVNAKEPLRIQVKSSYRMEDRYVSFRVEDPEVRGNAEGIVKLDIAIDKFGDVKSAKLNSASTITDEEVIEACKKAALRTDFSSNYDVTIQRGTITYTFYR